MRSALILMTILVCGACVDEDKETGIEDDTALDGDTGTADDTAIDDDPSCDLPRDRDGDCYEPPEDCDDANPHINPGADEVCDHVDNDCDGSIDVDAVDARIFYRDMDDDGFGHFDYPFEGCEVPVRYSTIAGDCHDRRADIYPGASEVCDGFDNDCDDDIDELGGEDITNWYRDVDGDGYGDADDMIEACPTPPGYSRDSGDCDDTDGGVYPGATEDCTDGIDNDCDEAIDWEDSDCRCGSAIGDHMIQRTTWGIPLMTQNSSAVLPSGRVFDRTDSEAVIEAIRFCAAYDYCPPWGRFPRTVFWPRAYNVGYELALYGFSWPDDHLNFPPTGHSFVGAPVDDTFPHTMVIHHTGSEPFDGCDQAILDIANLHTYHWGYGDIAYSYLVCEDTSGVYFYEGRWSGINRELDSHELFAGLHVVPASSYPNTGKVTIALVGDFSFVAPSAEEMSMLNAVTAQIATLSGISAEHIRPHSWETETIADEVADHVESCTGASSLH